MNPDNLMDQADVARLLGITTDSLRASRPGRQGRYRDMPDPLRQISGRPVWLRRDIEAWADGRVHDLWSYSDPTPDGHYRRLREATVDEFKAAAQNRRLTGETPGLVKVDGGVCFVTTRPGVVFDRLDDVAANLVTGRDDGALVEVNQGGKLVAQGVLVSAQPNVGYVEVARSADSDARIVDWRPGTWLRLLKQGAL